MPSTPHLQTMTAQGAIPPAQSPLPPSPNLSLDETTVFRSNTQTAAGVSRPLQSTTNAAPVSNRLRSVAKYNSFHPQALACSNDVLAGSALSFNSNNSGSSSSSSSSTPSSSSLGAIAGPKGIALFRLTRPHVPLVVFSHATSSSSSSTSSFLAAANRGQSISSLAFRPNVTTTWTTASTANNRPRAVGSAGNTNNNSSLYLAAARGSGVLLFDASGHSANPLLGRLVVDPFVVGGGHGSGITSMAWKPASRSQNAVLLATTTASALSMWDLRLPTTNAFQPALKFGASHQATRDSIGSGQRTVAPLVSVACASSPASEECATLDASGVVRIYDLRMTDRGSSSGGGEDATTKGSPVATFTAHEAGVGILHLPSGEDDPDRGTADSTWVTWGLETPMSSPVVKIWGTQQQQHQQNQMYLSSTSLASSDDYWYLGTNEDINSTYSPQRNSSTKVTGTALSTASFSKDYHLIARCSRPNLACARVCSEQMSDSLVVVGYMDDESSRSGGRSRGWWAELLQLSPGAKAEDSFFGSENFGLDQVAGFQGGSANTMVENNDTLASILGNFSVGNLQAAELAFSSINGGVSSTNAGTEPSRNKSQRGLELLLCCLSDTGIITTTAIPEASLQLPIQKTNDRANDSFLPKRKTASSVLRTALPSLATEMRIFPETREGNSLRDVAGLWGGKNFAPPNDNAPPGLNGGVLEPRPTSPVKGVNSEQESRNLPFDMEIPVPGPDAFGSAASQISGVQIGMTDMTGKTIVNSSLAGSTEQVEAQFQEAAAKIENIDTERIPCPRLCGATFARGNGGLVVFRNGEVQKMWQWYKKTDVDAKTLTQKNAVSRLDVIGSETDDVEMVGILVQGGTNSLPRTLKDMLDMTLNAKDAQWGEGNDASGTDDGLSVDNFFEDESVSSSDESEEDDDDEEEKMAEEAPDLYKRYFGGTKAWKGTVEKVEKQPSLSRTQTFESVNSHPRSKLSAAPSSDMLSPVVSVIHTFDAIRRDGKAIILAKRWRLGSWITSHSNRNDDVTINRSTDATIDDSSSHSRSPLPHYRDLVSLSPTRGNTFSKTRSDSNLIEHPSREKKLSNPMDDPGVHGGEYSVRPKMQESMSFLKKLLVSHRQEAGSTLPALMSPPESPGFLNRSRPSIGGKKIGRDHPGTALSLEEHSMRMDSSGLGVQTLQFPDTPDKFRGIKRLEEMSSLCRHNAEVCKECDEIEKQGVWNLLADTVVAQMNDSGKRFTGWGRALESEMVSTLLTYYEGVGDVQMLATIFCVLRGGNNPNDCPLLLPEGREDSYDNYIRRYAELLYGWGLLNVRADVNKHLSPKASRFENKVNLQAGPEKEANSGIVIALYCPKCANAVNPETNYCTQCGDWALRCSICDNSVRRALMLCETCGHGGHLSHLLFWFNTHSYCPTGCGCQCSFPSALRNGAGTGALVDASADAT